MSATDSHRCSTYQEASCARIVLFPTPMRWDANQVGRHNLIACNRCLQSAVRRVFLQECLQHFEIFDSESYGTASINNSSLLRHPDTYDRLARTIRYTEASTQLISCVAAAIPPSLEFGSAEKRSLASCGNRTGVCKHSVIFAACLRT